MNILFVVMTSRAKNSKKHRSRVPEAERNRYHMQRDILRARRFFWLVRVCSRRSELRKRQGEDEREFFSPTGQNEPGKGKAEPQLLSYMYFPPPPSILHLSLSLFFGAPYLVSLFIYFSRVPSVLKFFDLKKSS